MKNEIYRALVAKKTLVILAISAILAANVSAQEQTKEYCKGKQLSKEQRIEFDIKRLTNELLLSDQQAEKFAVTYREYAGKLDELFQKNAPKGDFEADKELTDKDLDKLAKARLEGRKELADLKLKYYDKFRQFLSARQTGKVLHLQGPCGRHECGDKPACGQHDGKQYDKHHGHHGHGQHDHQNQRQR